MIVFYKHLFDFSIAAISLILDPRYANEQLALRAVHKGVDNNASFVTLDILSNVPFELGVRIFHMFQQRYMFDARVF